MPGAAPWCRGESRAMEVVETLMERHKKIQLCPA